MVTSLAEGDPVEKRPLLSLPLCLTTAHISVLEALSSLDGLCPGLSCVGRGTAGGSNHSGEHKPPEGSSAFLIFSPRQSDTRPALRVGEGPGVVRIIVEKGGAPRREEMHLKHSGVGAQKHIQTVVFFCIPLTHTHKWCSVTSCCLFHFSCIFYCRSLEAGNLFSTLL